MSGELIGELILWLIVAIIVIVIVVYIVNWLYHRSSKEVSFVRTGFLGEKVCDRRRRLRAADHSRHHARQHERACRWGSCATRRMPLITRDRMRVDIEAEFYVRVEADHSRRSRSPHRRSDAAPWSRNSCTRCFPASSSRRSARSPPK